MFVIQQNGREPARKPTDKKSQQIDEMLSLVLNTIPEAPLDMIGATPRNNEMGKKFNMSDMHLPSKHKVRSLTLLFSFLLTMPIKLLFILITVPQSKSTRANVTA